MTDKPNLSSSVEDCPPEEKSGSGKKGPIVRMEEHVKRLQEAAGLEGDDIDGMLGPKSSEAIAKLGINDPEILKTLPAEIRESLDAIKEKLGKGMFEQHIKDPGECVVDGSAAEGLLHDDGGKGLYVSENPTRPLARPKAEEQIIEAPPARPKYDADGNKFGTDPTLLDKDGSMWSIEEAKEGGLLSSGPALHHDGNTFKVPKEAAPAIVDADTRDAFKGIENYDDGGQGEIMRLDQIDQGPTKIVPLDQIEVGPVEYIPVAANSASKPETSNPAAMDTSGFVENVVHDAGIALKNVFAAARDYLGTAPLDKAELSPDVAMAANLTTKPNPAAWTMSA